MNNKPMKPGDPKNCSAAKENPFACDECDHLMDCVPDWETAVAKPDLKQAEQELDKILNLLNKK